LVLALSNGRLATEAAIPEIVLAAIRTAIVSYFEPNSLLICSFTSSYVESCAKFKAIALTTVGEAPLQRPKIP